MRTVLWLLLAAALAFSADPKPDRKKSDAALLRGQKAADAGRGAEAIAAFTEAVQADPGNPAALRARGKQAGLNIYGKTREEILAMLGEVEGKSAEQ